MVTVGVLVAGGSEIFFTIVGIGVFVVVGIGVIVGIGVGLLISVIIFELGIFFSDVKATLIEFMPSKLLN